MHGSHRLPDVTRLRGRFGRGLACVVAVALLLAASAAAAATAGQPAPIGPGAVAAPDGVDAGADQAGDPPAVDPSAVEDHREAGSAEDPPPIKPAPAPPEATPATATAPSAEPLPKDIAYERWITRHHPSRNVTELGLAAGVLLPSADHELYDYRKTWQAYRPAAANFGLRAGFYPLSFLGVEAEGAALPTRTDAGERATIFGVRGHLLAQLPLYSVAPFALVGGGLLGTSGALGFDIDPSLHFGGGVKIFASRWVGARVDARAHVGPAHAREAFRTFYPEVTASVIVTLGRPYLDADRDGVPDPGQRARTEDACPLAAGLRSLRGCPDADRDGLRDSDDRCPTEAGLAARDGCPALVDADGDGYYDPGQYQIPADLEDECPGQDGVKEYRGCPAPDTDGDTYNDLVDRCPKEPETVNGFDDGDGCPDRLPPDVKKLLGTIRGIQFGFLSARLTENSREILGRAAVILAEYPELKLEIQGHTDGDGDPANNKEMSRRRAESVRDELIARGIVEERLTAVGYGSERPLDPEDTDASRAANRRIEFRLLDVNGKPLEVPDE